MKFIPLAVLAAALVGTPYASSSCCSASAAKPAEKDTEVKAAAVTVAVKAEAPAKMEVPKVKADKPVQTEVKAGETVKLAVVEAASCPVAGKCTAKAECGDKEKSECGDKAEAACGVREASSAAATCGDACSCKG